VHIPNLALIFLSMADSEILYTTAMAMQTLSEQFE
jgi:hypothetical protein